MQNSHAFLPRFDPMGVFCNVKLVVAARGFAAPYAVGKAGVLPKRLLLVVLLVPKPTNYINLITLIQLLLANISIQFYALKLENTQGVQTSAEAKKLLNEVLVLEYI